MVNKQLKRIFVFVILFAFVEIIIIGLGLFAFGAGELDQFFDKTVYFWAGGAISLIAMIAFAAWKAVNPSSAFANSYIFDPESGVLPDQPILRFNRSFFWTFVVFFAITAFFGMLGVFFVSRFEVTQQVTVVGKILLGTEPAAFTETLMYLGFLLPLLVGSLKFFTPNNKLLQYILMFTLIPLLVGLFGMSQHFLVYGEEQTKLLGVFAFWTLSAYVTLVTGSIMAAYLWHFNNNLFVSLKEQIQNPDTIVIGTIIFLIVLGFALIAGRIFITNKFRKRAEVINVT